MNQIKAIETHYRGFWFRSRLEARWAVFFDNMGISFEYELGGFELPSGRYLPDFWLPQVAMWAEVKPLPFEPLAEAKLRELAEDTQCGALMLVGSPDFRAYDGFFIYEPHDDPWEVVKTDYIIDTSYLDENRFYSATGNDKWPDKEWFGHDYEEAVYTSRCARFDNFVPRERSD